MTLLGIDPGKTIGWSVWRDDGTEYTRGTFQYEDINRVFELRFDRFGSPSRHSVQLWFRPAMYGGYLIDQLVIEDYIGRPGQKNGGQRFWGPESLAKIELLGELAGIEVVRQRAVDVLKISAAHAGYTLPKGHLPDADSAYLHARYRLEQLGVLRAVPLDD